MSFFFGSIFNLPDENVQSLIEQSGGFMYGICYPNENYDMISDAGLEWVHFDIPFPFNRDGTPKPSYYSVKEIIKGTQG